MIHCLTCFYVICFGGYLVLVENGGKADVAKMAKAIYSAKFGQRNGWAVFWQEKWLPGAKKWLWLGVGDALI